MSSVAVDQAFDPEGPQRVVLVLFEANDGRRWQAVGGGATLDEAIAFARSCTPREYWRVTRTSDLYGD